MRVRFSAFVIAVVSVLTVAIAGAQAHDEKKYPDLRGQWRRIGSAEWTPAGQKPPLTPEYQAIYDAGLKDQLSPPTCAYRPGCLGPCWPIPRWKSSSPRTRPTF
jgi:hypothetical protein